MKNKKNFLHQVAANYIIGNDINVEIKGESAQLKAFQELLETSRKLREALHNENNLDIVLSITEEKKKQTKKFQNLTGIPWEL
jgi:hypothetical protein